MGITERIDAITGIPPDFRRAAPPPPRSVKIELTGRCNFNCAFCARSKVLRDQSDMDWGFYKRITEEMSIAGVEELGLFYLGESFLCKWLPDAVAHAAELFPYVFLTTNGSVSSPERMEACMRAGLDSLKFSMNYADEEQFCDIARVKPALFHKMIENIKASKDIRDQVYEDTGKRCGLYASYIKYDDEQMERILPALEEIKPFVDQLYALPLYNQADHVTEDERERGWSPTAGNRGRYANLRDPLPCWAVFTEGHITWDGRLSACCFDHDGRFNMGDLNEMTFMEAWHSKSFRDLRVKHLRKNVTNTVCENCVAYS